MLAFGQHAPCHALALWGAHPTRRGTSTGPLLLRRMAPFYAGIDITSNLPFDEWTEVFGAERLTGAILDRLTHHVHILEMNGESYRLRQSKIAKP